MQKILRKALLFSIISLGTISYTQASSLQAFTGINYSNPANLTLQINDMQILLGDDVVIPHIVFRGTTTVPPPVAGFSTVTTSGQASTNLAYSLPYIRIAKRLTSQLVVSADLTEPFKSDIIYSKNSIIRYITTISKTHSTDIGLNIAYQLTGRLSKLAIGAGLDILNFSAEVDSKYPSFPTFTQDFGAGPDAVVTKSARGLSYGWHAGLVYRLLEGTFLDLSYFSAMSPRLEGNSSLTGFPTSTNAKARINLPDTTNFAITQFLNPKWFISAGVHYTGWGRLQVINIYNVAGPTPTQILTPHYKNTWKFDLGTLYHVTPKFDLGGSLSYDQTPTNGVDRSVTQPDIDHYSVSFLTEYKFFKNWSAGVSYAHTFFPGKVPINYTDPNSFAVVQGNAHSSADTIGAWLRFNV